MTYASPTSINTAFGAFGCKYKWKQGKVNPEPDLPSAARDKGVLVHKMVEYHHKAQPIDFDIPEEYAVSCEQMFQICLNKLSRYMLHHHEIYIEQQRSITAKGKPCLRDDKDCFLTATGDIDFYSPEQKTWYVIDIKSGWSDIPIDKYDIQFLCNALLINQYNKHSETPVQIDVIKCVCLKLNHKAEERLITEDMIAPKSEFWNELIDYRGMLEKILKMSRDKDILLCTINKYCDTCRYAAHVCPRLRYQQGLAIPINKIETEEDAGKALLACIASDKYHKAIQYRLKEYYEKTGNAVNINEFDDRYNYQIMVKQEPNFNDKFIKHQLLTRLIDTTTREELIQWLMKAVNLTQERVSGLGSELIEIMPVKTTKRAVITINGSEEENEQTNP